MDHRRASARVRQTATCNTDLSKCGRLFRIAAAAISRNERYSQKFIMRTNISRGDATNVNLCRQLQMQFTELHARLSRTIAACVYVSADRGAYQTAKFANNVQQWYNLILHSARVHAWSSTFILNASFM